MGARDDMVLLEEHGTDTEKCSIGMGCSGAAFVGMAEGSGVITAIGDVCEVLRRDVMLGGICSCHRPGVLLGTPAPVVKPFVNGWGEQNAASRVDKGGL
eukprot:6181457-Ditylum_brightwellii.AAC.1